MADKPLKKFVVSDLDGLQKDFFRNYHQDYWLYKMNLLKATHDNFEEIKEPLLRDLKDVSEDDYKKTLRTEMHFLYFQMIEALFEMFFALGKHDNRDLWVALTFSNDWSTSYYSNCYKKIQDFSRGVRDEFHSSNTVTQAIDGKDVRLPLLQWIFYFVQKTALSEEQMAKNLTNIETLLKFLATDFTDRKEYNAYKHSLRFYNAGYSLSIGRTGSAERHVMGQARDAIYYLEDKPVEGQSDTYSVQCVIKPFDFERDYYLCWTIDQLMRNMMDTRRYSLVDELLGKPYEFTLFNDMELSEVLSSRTGITKASSNF